MLIWMRDSAFAGVFKFLLMGLLLMAVIGLIFLDTGGFFSGTGMSSNTVAKGGGISIGINDFDRTVRRALSQQGIPASEAYKLGLIDNILTSEVQSRLFTERARALGLEVGDEVVQKKISELAEPLATDGRTKKEALQQILRTQNISESEFVGSVRQEMANGLLRGALTAPATMVSPRLANALYRYDNETRAAAVMLLRNADTPGITTPTDEQLQKYYEANKSDYLIPESRRVTVATLKSDMVAKNVNITDEQLRAEYDKNIATFTKPPRRTVEQVVLPDEAAANAAAADMKAGKPVKDTNVQDFEREGLLPEIATPVFEAKQGAVVGPIKSPLGWHVLKVTALLPESVAPFDDVKSKLRDELKSIAMNTELYQAGIAIEDRAAAGDKLEDIVNEYGMTTEIIGPFRQNGNDADGKDLFKSFGPERDKLIQSAFDFEEGEVTPVVETADGQFHIMRIEQVIPDTYRDLASVKAELRQRWMDEQRDLSNKARAEKALADLNGGADLSKVAGDNGAKTVQLTGISRKENPAPPLTPIVAAQIFATDVGKNFSSKVNDGYVVGRVTGMTLPPADAKPEKAELDGLEDLTGRSLAQDIFALYTESLGRSEKVMINKAVLDQVYGGDGQSQPAQ